MDKRGFSLCLLRRHTLSTHYSTFLIFSIFIFIKNFYLSTCLFMLALYFVIVYDTWVKVVRFFKPWSKRWAVHRRLRATRNDGKHLGNNNKPKSFSYSVSPVLDNLKPGIIFQIYSSVVGNVGGEQLFTAVHNWSSSWLLSPSRIVWHGCRVGTSVGELLFI